MASQVKGLRGKEFDAEVRTMKYDVFVSASQQAYEQDGLLGTPTFAVNGDVVPDRMRPATFDAKLLPAAVRMVAAGVAPTRRSRRSPGPVPQTGTSPGSCNAHCRPKSSCCRKSLRPTFPKVVRE
ncbi:DsbA family protein [Streptomyces sp. NBC_00009]|uniref:DsbA family protein n=1 Tax=Streptomyces sp. NBC_00009 TaxID=2975620 RepID=UPI00324361DB